MKTIKIKQPPLVVIIKNESEEFREAKLFGYFSAEDFSKMTSGNGDENIKAIEKYNKDYDNFLKDFKVNLGHSLVTFMELCVQVLSQPIYSSELEIISDNPLQKELLVNYKDVDSYGNTNTYSIEKLSSGNYFLGKLGDKNQISFMMFPKTTVVAKIHPGETINYSRKIKITATPLKRKVSKKKK